ncbi:malate synthase [Paenarthrobacter nicotinovorans]|uniref:Malate synthase n=1 Tax=Paenarthrobacter nicotinovorans TaxID=29320 RepID=A0ABT9TQS4_PAENI|nr:malate synthase [Paenarthrobacter nicotinovorans]
MNSFTDNFTINGITLTAHAVRRQNENLTPEALKFISTLHWKTEKRRPELLKTQQTRRAAIRSGQDPRFLPATAQIRDDPSWRVAPPAPGLEDRRVEALAGCGRCVH